MYYYASEDEEIMKECMKIVDSLLANPKAADFYDPVPWKEWGLKNYSTIVKYPMDLRTIKRRYGEGYYGSALEIFFDIRAIWIACTSYNPKTEAIHKLAQRFSDECESAFRSIMANYITKKEPITNEVKQNLASYLAKASSFALMNIYKASNQFSAGSISEDSHGLVYIDIDKLSEVDCHFLLRYLSSFDGMR